MREARLYEQLADERVQCHLCAHECTIAEGGRGICHECGKILIRRSGYRLERNAIAKGRACPKCGTAVAGVGMASVESRIVEGEG